jgi:2,3-bisphosphoglycerate-dependent phosphoglycerate mutase
MPSSIILIRHCQSSGQAPDATLTPQGLADAEHLVPRLASLGVDAVFSSPYTRALQTVTPFAAARGISINVDGRLQERLLSAEPLDDWLAHIEASFANFDYRAPGGETLHEAQARGLAALKDIGASQATMPAAASHGNLLASLLNWINPSFGFSQWQAMANPALYRVTFRDGEPKTFELLD